MDNPRCEKYKEKLHLPRALYISQLNISSIRKSDFGPGIYHYDHNI